jgi:predicted lipoprotein with Yx(FWY)xxD motif
MVAMRCSIEVVILPVADVGRGLAFYAETAGFTPTWSRARRARWSRARTRDMSGARPLHHADTLRHVKATPEGTLVIRGRPVALLTATLTLPLAALTVGACGGNDDSGNAASGGTKTAPATTVALARAGSLGKILVDSRGRTIYLFDKDARTKSACSGDCAIDWPPVRAAGRPTVGGGLAASKLGTTRRSDGTSQITYNGHPLYRFEGDHSPGDANGQGLNAFGAAWYVVSPSGNQITGSSGGGGGVY